MSARGTSNTNDRGNTADRIIPGCDGGTYARDNIRPACGKCNSTVGGALRRKAA